MAKRYGVMPSAFIHQDPFEFTFNLLVAQVGTNNEAEEMRRARQKAATGGR